MEIQEAAQREQKQSRSRRPLHAPRPLDARSGAADAPAGDAAALRPAARGVPAGGRRADRKAARAAHRARRAQQGRRGPPARRGVAGFPAGISRDLPRHRVGRRAIGQARFGARAPRGLHRIAPSHGPAGEQRAGVSDRAPGAVLRHRLLLARLRRAAGGRRVRVRPPGAAHRDAHSDRHERSGAPLLVLRPHRDRGGRAGASRGG